MTEREQLLDELARCYLRTAVDALLAEASPESKNPAPTATGAGSIHQKRTIIDSAEETPRHEKSTAAHRGTANLG
jgi:hypothetical protein